MGEKKGRIRGSEGPGVGIAILNTVVRMGFLEEVTFEQRIEGGER